jgi:hypothetical protein
MPYISSKDDRREKLRNGEPALTAGELNYQIFYYVKYHYMENDITASEIIISNFVAQFLGNKPNYQKYNDMTGALIRCGKEIQRRLNNDYAIITFHLELLEKVMESYDDEIAKYEDLKCQENGDVE